MSPADFCILCIEDNVELREDLACELRCDGYVVREAGDGREGLDIILRGDVDLVLCDVQLPSLDGIGLLRELQRRTATPPPIVMLTAYSDRLTRDLALAAGAHAVMVKPIDFEEVLTLTAAIRAQRSPRCG
jgi:DNA-binding response OmpR family regulator